MPSGDRLDQYDPALGGGNGVVAGAAWHPDELPGAELYLAILELDAKPPTHDEKQLVILEPTVAEFRCVVAA